MSNSTDEMIEKPKNVLKVEFPRMHPSKEIMETTEKAAKTIKNGCNWMVLVQILSQVFLKGGMDYMYELYFTLQIVVYIYYYEFQKPSSAEVFISIFKDLIEFRILSPEPFVQIWIKDFTLKDFLSSSQEKGSFV